MKSITVSAAVIHDGKRIYAVRRSSGPFKGGWEFPGGKSEDGESPEETIIREIKEELITDISVEKLLTTIDYDYPDFRLKMHVFICSVIGSGPTLTEHDEAKWLDVSNLESVNWLPADALVIGPLRKYLQCIQ